MRFSVSRIERHPLFDRAAKFDHDFALLRLDRPVSFGRRPDVRPVCLPEPGDDGPSGDADLVGLTGQASGWGVLDPLSPSRQARRLQVVSVSVLANRLCRDKYRPNPITDNMLCAATPGGDACFGDSGGPLTVREKGSAVLEGVISWGKNCAKARWPGVYSRVRKVMDWVKQKTRDSQTCVRDVSYGGGKGRASNQEENDEKKESH